MDIRPFQEADRAAVIQLWRDCDLTTPANDPDLDIDRKLAFQPDLLFVGIRDNNPCGTIMAGYDGHRGWINYLAIAPALQRQGLARQLMQHAEQALAELGCPKVNLQVRATNTSALAFYEALGYEREDRHDFGRRLG